MARKTPGNLTADSPPMTDDFSLIKGIGPVLSRRLHEAGLCTYSQLSSLSPDELAEKVGGLSAKQIARQDWIGQAAKLATPKKHVKTQPKKAVKQDLRQHYQNFTIEFLLDEKNKMRRTRAVHVQSGDADTWVGWEADQLLDFLARHTGTRLPRKKMEKEESLPVPLPSPGNHPLEPAPNIVKLADPKLQLGYTAEASQPGPETVPIILQAPGNAGFAGTLRLQDFCIMPVSTSTTARFLRQDQPCQARITFDLTAVVIPSDLPLQYKVTITFKQLGGVSYLVAEENNPIKRSDCMTLTFACTTPPPGLYRPEAFVKLFTSETAPGLMASLKGELIQVF